MRNLLVRLLAFEQRQLSKPAMVCLLLVGVPLAVYAVMSLNTYFYVQDNAPRWHVASLISSEKQYYKAHGHYLLGMDAELRSLASKEGSGNPGICPRGGHHSVLKYGTGDILVRCSLWQGSQGILKSPRP